MFYPMVIRTVVLLHSSSCRLLTIGTYQWQKKRIMSFLTHPTFKAFQRTVLFPNVSLEFNTTNQDYFFSPHHFILHYCETCLIVSHNKCCLASLGACGHIWQESVVQILCYCLRFHSALMLERVCECYWTLLGADESS